MSEGSGERDPAELRLTPAGTERLDELATLMDSVMAEAWSPASVASELANRSARGWLIDADGALSGFLLARILPGALEVMALGVAAGQRRRGLARRLLAAAEAYARRAGVDELLLDVRATNVAALELYGASGFVVVGRRPRYYPDGEDAVLMTRTLEPAPR